MVFSGWFGRYYEVQARYRAGLAQGTFVPWFRTPLESFGARWMSLGAPGKLQREETTYGGDHPRQEPWIQRQSFERSKP